MNAMVRNRFLQQYTQTNMQTGVEGATPHRLVQMLYEGALDIIAQAKGAMIRKDYMTKGKRVNHAITIISGLSVVQNEGAAVGITVVVVVLIWSP